MKRTLRFISVMLLLVTTLLSTFSITAQAAIANEYGWYWKDSNVTRYTFGLTETAFKKTDFYYDFKSEYENRDIERVSSQILSYYARKSGKTEEVSWVLYKGTKFYGMDGQRLYSDLKAESPDYIGYDKDGLLYVVTSSGKLLSFKSNNSSYTTLLSSGVIKLYQDDNDLTVKVGTSSGVKTLPYLTEESSPSSEAYVINYRTSGNHIIYEAYKYGSVYLTVTCDNSYVYVAGYTISEDCRGAKFVGIDSSYNVYLQDTSGTIYKYYYGSWTKPYSTKMSGDVYEFNYDSNGFFESIATSNGTYKIGSLTFSR